MKCPNCHEEITSDKIGESRAIEEDKKYGIQLKKKHKNICFFCERVDRVEKGTALVNGYLLCTEHAIFIQQNDVNSIKSQFGQDIDAKSLKDKINMEPI